MSYSDVADHRNMVFDGVRNAAYTRALEKVVGPDTTVMDLGAGLGILGLMAARLGAGKVYLVEPTVAIELARQAAADNGLSAVECIRATAEQLKLNDNLDAKVDVIVSVFTGNFLLEEDLLPSLFYARDHHLAPGGQLIPDRGRMEVVPVSAADYYEKYIGSWGQFPEHCRKEGLPEIEYRAVRPYAANSMAYDTTENIQAQRLGAPAPLLELDFNTAQKAECDADIEVLIESDGICHGWMGWFQIRLVNEWLSTDGEQNKTHWSQVFLPLEQPLTVVTGDRLRLALKRPEGGQWSWSTTLGSKSQRQSSFLSQPLRPQDLLKQSDHYRPQLHDKAQGWQWLLDHINGEASVTQLASELRLAQPGMFASEAQALQFVRAVAESLG
ncbi:MAG: putative RNA methylase [Halioglobus sp.]|jgi:predicted RNA methylase